MLRIGIDGGGTTTRAVVIDDKLQPLGYGEAASSNHYSVGVERAVTSIREAATAALGAAAIDADAIDGWGMGLAGACSATEQEMLRSHLSPLCQGRPLVVDEDAAAAQAGAFGGGSGAVCIAGTGANCFGRNERGARYRSDGLGPLLGDRGSGYWIGEKALRAICRANDGSGPSTCMREAILAYFQVGSIDELVQHVYRPQFEKSEVAALFPIAVRCAGARDDVAHSILLAAGRQLAATARGVLMTLAINRVAVTGGVLSRDTPVRASFENALRGSIPGIHISEPLHDPTTGAALLVKL